MKPTYIQSVSNRIMYLQKSGAEPIQAEWGNVERSWKEVLFRRPKWQFCVVYRSKGVDFNEVLFRGSPEFQDFLKGCIDWWAIRYQQQNHGSNPAGSGTVEGD